MQHRAGLALVLAACAKTPAQAPVTARCIPLAEAAAEADRARARNDQRFQARLADKDLQLVALATAGVENSEQTQITVDTRTRDGVTTRVLRTPSWTCATSAMQFAKNAARELYALDIHERATGGSITACGCRPPSGGASCGGAAVAPITILYVVPDELTYKGTVDITYDVDPHDVLFTGTPPDGGRCPPREPPPP